MDKNLEQYMMTRQELLEEYNRIQPEIELLISRRDDLQALLFESSVPVIKSIRVAAKKTAKKTVAKKSRAEVIKSRQKLNEEKTSFENDSTNAFGSGGYIEGVKSPHLTKLIFFLRQNPGASKESVRALFDGELDEKQIRNTLGNGVRRDLIVNRGTRPSPAWYVTGE